MNATADEIKDALRGLSVADQIRLRDYARFRVAMLSHHSWEDLLQESVLAALDGRRRWDPSRVDFKRFLKGVMQSTSSHWAEQHKNRRTALDSEAQSNDADAGPVEVAPSAGPDPESVATVNEMLGNLETMFEGDTVVLCIMQGVLDGMKGPEIQKAPSISKTEYETAMKRLRRKARRVAFVEAGHA